MTTTAAHTSDAKQAIIIRPPHRWVPVDLRELWAFRDLARSFAARDITLRYRQTALGVIWVIAQPLIAAGIFTFVFGRVAKLPSGGIPYLVFSYAGLLAWTAFSTTVIRSAGSLVGNVGIVSKVYFPRLLLPVSVLGSTLLDFLVSLCLMIVLLLVYHVSPGLNIVLLPVLLIILILLAVGVGAAAAALAVPYRDVQYMLPVLMQFMLYASPVAYAVAAVPGHLRALVGVNPLTGILEGFRWALLGGSPFPARYLIWSAAVSVIVFVAGVSLFKAYERDFADVI